MARVKPTQKKPGPGQLKNTGKMKANNFKAPKGDKQKQKQNNVPKPKQQQNFMNVRKKSLTCMEALFKRRQEQMSTRPRNFPMSPMTSHKANTYKRNALNAKQQTMANSFQRNTQKNTATQPLADTIVIDDSDEENEPTNPKDGNCQDLFYLDCNPGKRDEEVPLYTSCFDAITPNVQTNAVDESVVVLDSTLEQTVSNSMEDLRISSDDIPPPSVPAPTSSEIVSNERPEQELSSPTPKDPTEVIELSDFSDVEPSTSEDVIPLGYDVLQPNAGKKRSKKRTKSKTTAEVTIPPELAISNANKRMVIIDGNNVAYGHLNGKMFSVKGLELCLNYFQKLGHEVVAVVPQYKLKKHQSTDYKRLDELHRAGVVTLAPSKSLPGQCSSTYDDRLILSVAQQFDGVIISNDNFRDLLDISPSWRRIIQTRVIGYTWVKDCFFLPDDPYGRFGPTLQQMLNGQSE